MADLSQVEPAVIEAQQGKKIIIHLIHRKLKTFQKGRLLSEKKNFPRFFSTSQFFHLFC